MSSDLIAGPASAEALHPARSEHQALLHAWIRLARDPRKRLAESEHAVMACAWEHHCHAHLRTRS